MYPRTESGEDEDSGWRPLAVTQTGAGRQADDWGDGQYSNFNSSQGEIEVDLSGGMGDCQERLAVINCYR